MRTLEVHPNWENATPEELRVAMEAAPHRRSYVRFLAVRALLLGYTRAQVCELCARSDRMLRLWIELFNRGGIDALRTKKSGHRPRKVKLERVRDLLVPVLKNPAQAGVVHWTGVKVHGYLKEQLCVDLGYRTAIRWLHELNFHLRVPRPWPERQNEQEREAFRERLRGWTRDSTVKLWFSDECGVEGDPRPRRRWVQPGQPRTVPYLGDHMLQATNNPDGKPLFQNIPELFDAAKDKAAKPLSAVVVRIATRAADFDRAWEIARSLAAPLRVFASPTGNELIPLHNDEYPFEAHEQDVLNRQSRRSGMILTSDELLGFVHLPSPEVRSSKLVRQVARTRPAPVEVQRSRGLLLGHNTHAGQAIEVRISPDRRPAGTDAPRVLAL